MFESNWRSKNNTEKHRHTNTNQTFLFHLGTLCNQPLPKPSNLHELWPGLHQASANSELACRRHKDKWPYQCKVPNDWQVWGLGGLCGQTHVVALDKPLWNERAHLWVLCGSGTSPPAERGNMLVCSSYERSRVYHTTIIWTWPWLTSVLEHTTSIQDAFQLWLLCHNMEWIIIEDLDMSSFSVFCSIVIIHM